jgi:flagella basal body P-ring formation protein FlgA
MVIEESSDLVETRLQAVALGRAAPGEFLEVRLRMTGKVLRAVALAPGLAEFAHRHEVRP